MRTLVAATLFLGLVSLLPVGASAQSAHSPVGTWAVAINGRDPGITYLTFATNLTWTGYGLSLGSFGPFTIAGTWDLDSKGRVVGGYTQYLPDDSIPGIIAAKVSGGNKFRGVATTNRRHFGLVGGPTNSVPDVSGNWNAEVKSHGDHFFEHYTLAVSTNMTGWFDIAGQGTDSTGPFTLSGALIINRQRRANGYTISDYGSSVTTTSSFRGRFQFGLKKVTFVGRDTDNHQVIIHATQ